MRRAASARLSALLTVALRAVGIAIFRARLHRLVMRLGRARPKVLCYHAVEPRESDFTRGLQATVSPAAFAEHLRFLGRHYRIVPVAEVASGRAGDRAVAITFDDGYRSALAHAVPRLAERRWPSTHYVVTGAVGNRALVWVNELTWFRWNHPRVTGAALERSFGLAPDMSIDRVISAIRQRYDAAAVAVLLDTLREATGVDPEALAREAQLYLDWRDVATMHAAGLTFGNHTVTHPSLPRLDDDAQREEIDRGRAALEQHVGRVTSLAVPFGDLDETTRRIAAASGHTSIAEVGGVNDGRDPRRIARVVVTAPGEAELFAEMELVTPVRAWLKEVGARGAGREARDARPDGGRGLRVLYVWFSDYPWDVRAEKVCAALTAAGHEVHLVARNRRGEPLRSVLPEATVHRIAPWRRIGRRVDAALQFPIFVNPRWTRLLRRVAREARPDVIIARDLPLCPAAIRLGRRLGVPVVLDMAENYPAFMRVMRDAGHHGLVDRVLRSPRVLAAVERYCVARVDRVLTVVEESAARVARLGVPIERIRVVSNTPARARADRAASAERRGPGDRLEVVYLGLLEVPRGIDEVIDAAALLRDSGTPIRVTLVGDGRDALAFRARASAAGLTKTEIVFAGHLPLAAALDVVAAADVGVVPLRRCEAYDTTVSNKLFDYMAHGLAVATSDTLPSARIVRETGAGEVFCAGDAKDLAATLRRLADPVLRRSAGEAGRRAVLERYNWERDAATLCETVEELAGLRSGGAETRNRRTIRALAGLTLGALAGAGCSAAGRADAAPPVGSGYDAVSPHWPHIRLQVTDYRIQYQSATRDRAAEYAWTAAHFDRVMLDFGDARSVPEYRRLNPRAQLFRYALNWTMLRPGEDRREDPSVSYYVHMQQWYARNPRYRFEDAFLHDRARCGQRAAVTPGCRITFKIWTQMRWAVNPGDPGLRAYQRERLAAVAADVDGLFVDEHASGNFADLRRFRILEYPDWPRYERDMLGLLREVRAGLGARKRMLLNTNTYLTPFDAEMIAVAGGTHAEAFNNPVFPEMEQRWRFAESIGDGGAWMDMASGGDMPLGYNAGNSATPTARRRLWDLASYYLVAPSQPGALTYNPGNNWKQPFRDEWLAAVEVDVGQPRGARRLMLEGRDPTGRRFRVWARDFERAWILVRPVIEWGNNSFGDDSAVEVRTPAVVRPIDADGRVAPRVTRVRLRAGEASILLKDGA